MLSAVGFCLHIQEHGIYQPLKGHIHNFISETRIFVLEEERAADGKVMKYYYIRGKGYLEGLEFNPVCVSSIAFVLLTAAVRENSDFSNSMLFTKSSDTVSYTKTLTKLSLVEAHLFPFLSYTIYCELSECDSLNRLWQQMEKKPPSDFDLMQEIEFDE